MSFCYSQFDTDYHLQIMKQDEAKKSLAIKINYTSNQMDYRKSLYPKESITNNRDLQ